MFSQLVKWFEDCVFFYCIGIRSNNITIEEYQEMLKIRDRINNFKNCCEVFYNTENNSICSICLENMDNQYVIKIKNCSHSYHHKCLKLWICKSDNCPLCRKLIL